jgi:serine/threonine-protein kinase
MTQPACYANSLLGRQLCGKWLLLRVIGSGGMSTVFEAMHRSGRRVAIKVLHPELALRQRLRGRFKREAYVANRIDHHDVVQILDEDTTDDGFVFIVMEYLEGETLGSRLKRVGEPLGPAEVVSAAVHVLDILAVAHRSGVIHRDIKPDNIFRLRDQPRIKLLDFGIASLREISAGGAELTEAGVPLGTPAFMAPEQARGLCDRVDARTDLWGLGATMFTLLTGRFVHAEGNACEILIAAGTKAAPSLQGVADRVGPELASVVDRALAFEKSARWPDAASMQNALVALFPSVRERTFVGSAGRTSAPFEQDTIEESHAERMFEGCNGERHASAPPASKHLRAAGLRATTLRVRKPFAAAAITLAAGVLWSQALGLGAARSASPIPAGSVRSAGGESTPPIGSSLPEVTAWVAPFEKSATQVSPAMASPHEVPATSPETGGAKSPVAVHRSPGTALQPVVHPRVEVDAPVPVAADPLDRR